MSYFLLDNTLKGIANTPVMDLLRMITLRRVKTTFLTLKGIASTQSFIYGSFCYSIGFALSSDWIEKWCDFLSQSCSVAMKNQILFNAQVKTTLYRSFKNGQTKLC